MELKQFACKDNTFFLLKLPQTYKVVMEQNSAYTAQMLNTQRILPSGRLLLITEQHQKY